MELNELFLSRRSVRSYKPGVISEDTLREILGAARLAPSWKNTQTARSYVACTPEAVAKVRALLPGFNQKSTANAAAYIVTSFAKDVAGFTGGKADNELGNQVGSYDLGLYHSYLILKAEDLGIDSLIMGLRDTEGLRALLQIPENEEISMVLALGYREDKEIPLRASKSVDEIAKFF